MLGEIDGVYRQMTHKLITIGPSHYCEKVKWAFKLAGIDYVEDAHAPIFHLPYVKLAGGTRTVPVLKTPTEVIGDSTEILAWIQAKPDARWIPYPDKNSAKIRELEDEFDEIVGPHVRRVAYWHLLPNKALALRAIGGDSPNWETKTIDMLYDQCVKFMFKSMNIHADSVIRSNAKIMEVFDRVGQRLRDGRTFLMNDSLTAADITFASLAAPMLLPEKYGWTLPSIDEVPAGFRAEVDRYRATAAGEFALRIYATHR